jgi:hypothetical protein
VQLRDARDTLAEPVGKHLRTLGRGEVVYHDVDWQRPARSTTIPSSQRRARGGPYLLQQLNPRVGALEQRLDGERRAEQGRGGTDPALLGRR